MKKSAVRSALPGLCVTVMFLSVSLTSANDSLAPCPRTPEQSSAWINRAVDSLVRSAYAAFQDERAQDRHQRVVDGIAKEIQRCGLGDADISKHYPEFVQYVKLLSRAGRDDHQLGFEVTDRQYFAETSRYTTIPEFLLTPDFLRLVSGYENLARAKSVLRDLNKSRAPNEQLLFFSYASRHLGTPDNPDSYRRLLIIVPGDSANGIPEKWVQFGIADPRRPRTVRNVSVVAVMLGKTDGANTYFKDYFRTYRRNGTITIKGRLEEDDSDDPCVTCHKSGVLPIFPVAGSVSREEQDVLERVNERFRGYGVARFGRYIDLAKFGPGLGSSPVYSQSMSLTDRFKTRSCTSCHNANGLGTLNWPMDGTLINSFVTGGKMPLNAKLSSVQRNQLYRQLVGEYFAIEKTQPGILQSWLLGKMRNVQAIESEPTAP
jgi:hypothetical protein